MCKSLTSGVNMNFRCMNLNYDVNERALVPFLPNNFRVLFLIHLYESRTPGVGFVI